MTLSLPLVGIGLSYTDLDVAAAATGLIIAGSVYAFLVLTLWPERAPDSSSPAGPAPVAPTLGNGLRLAPPERPPRRSGSGWNSNTSDGRAPPP